MQEWKTLHWVNKNTKRYYSIFLQQDLFGNWEIIRANGGIGNRLGQLKILLCDNYESAIEKLYDISRVRKQHNYISFVKDSK